MTRIPLPPVGWPDTEGRAQRHHDGRRRGRRWAGRGSSPAESTRLYCGSLAVDRGALIMIIMTRSGGCAEGGDSMSRRREIP